MSILLGGSLMATRSDALDLIPPALRDAARGGKRGVAVRNAPCHAAVWDISVLLLPSFFDVFTRIGRRGGA
jgi:hypothetical protein